MLPNQPGPLFDSLICLNIAEHVGDNEKDQEKEGRLEMLRPHEGPVNSDIVTVLWRMSKNMNSCKSHRPECRVCSLCSVYSKKNRWVQTMLCRIFCFRKTRLPELHIREVHRLKLEPDGLHYKGSFQPGKIYCIFRLNISSFCSFKITELTRFS